jgi:hypothetical protein
LTRLKPQCANACGYLLPERSGPTHDRSGRRPSFPGWGSIIADWVFA